MVFDGLFRGHLDALDLPVGFEQDDGIKAQFLILSKELRSENAAIILRRRILTANQSQWRCLQSTTTCFTCLFRFSERRLPCGHSICEECIDSHYPRSRGAYTYSIGPCLLCGVGYGLQLFFDFAGFTHIAIGAAKSLGITVPENFERPFASANPSEFWTRWHMSLSFWIRDYVFFPLATLRREMWWRHLALVLSMVVFGLWHKATLLFLLWGSYHGLLLVAHRLWQQGSRRFNWHPGKIWGLLGWFVTAVLISLGWVFFRANSTAQAREMVRSLGSVETYGSHFLSFSLYLLIAVLATGYGISLLIVDALKNDDPEATRERSGIVSLMARSRWFWLPAIYALALLAVLMITLTQQGGVGQMMYRSF